MSIYAPNSDVWLMSAPLTYGDQNQIDFQSPQAQDAYFRDLATHGVSFTDFSYQRKDMYIRVPALADTLYKYNYCMYRNFDGQMIYCFITRVEFVNQNCSNIHIKTDVFQTWLFYTTFFPCMVIREHTATDNIFEHTLPENIPVQEAREITRYNALPYSLRNQTAGDFAANYRVLIVCSEAVAALGGGGSVGQVRFGAVPAGCYYYGVEADHVKDALENLVTLGKIDSVVDVYCVPIDGLNWVSLITDPYNVWLALDARYGLVNIPIAENLSYFGKTIKNKKCLCYPYNYYRLHNGAGQAIDLEPQKFGGTTIYIKSWFDGNCAPSVIAMPAQYDTEGGGENWGGATNPDFQISYSEFPAVPFTVDVYKQYLAENKSRLQFQGFQQAMNLTLGYARKVRAEKEDEGEQATLSMYNTVMSVAGFLANLDDLGRRPDKVVGKPSGSAAMLAGSAGVWVSHMVIRPEYLQIVDEFFTAYGYNVSRIKTPQFTSRPNHNYIETRDCKLAGLMPQDDADELCTMFNRGLTVWHNPNTFGDYSVNNAPA